MNSTQLVTRSTTIALFADAVPAILSGNRVGDHLAAVPSHTTTRALSHVAVSDLCLTKASKIEKSCALLNH